MQRPRFAHAEFFVFLPEQTYRFATTHSYLTARALRFTKQWSKREAQILTVIDSTVGMVGDLQGIAGKGMPEISSLEVPLLDGPETTEN